MNTETILAIIGAVATLVSAFSVGSLIKFHYERKDSKDADRQKVHEHTEEIKDLRGDLSTMNGRMELIEAMCLGSLYDRAKFLGEQYIARGVITTDEYEDWLKYLYTPYHEAGGDGTIDRIKAELDRMSMLVK